MFSMSSLTPKTGLLLRLALIIGLAACGGSGDGTPNSGGGILPDNDSEGGGSTSSGSSYGISLTATSPEGQDATTFTRTQPLTITVTVENVSGTDRTPVVSESVDLTTTVGAISPASGTALTDDSGVATFEISYDEQPGTGTVQVSYAGMFETVMATLSVEAIEIPVEYALTLSTQTEAGITTSTFSESSPLILIATLTETAGGIVSPIIGEIVSISTDLATVAPSNGSALTDENGQATFLLTYKGVVGAGAIDVLATVSGETLTKVINVQAGDSGSSPPYSIAVSLKDSLGGLPTTEFSSSNPLIVAVSLVEGGAGLADRLVELTSTVGTVSPENNVALTNAAGVATFEIAFADETGAGTVEASYVAAAGTVTASANAEAVLPTLKLGFLDAGVYIPEIQLLPTDSVSYKGSASVLFQVITEADTLVASDQEIFVSSPCIDVASATLSSPNPVISSGGVVSLTYSATEDCVGTDLITATLIQAGKATEVTASATLTIQDAGERFITFVGSDPDVIALSGTGGGTTLGEHSQVTFAVADVGGTPIAGHTVDFAMSTNVGGVELIDFSAISDAAGEVTATVRSGHVATVVRVIASIEASPGVSVSVVSDELTITSGVPDQNSISISSEILAVPSAMTSDGIMSVITVRMADRFNNPVPDGTAASFQTEYGAIEGSCTTTAGACSVTWTSQDPRFPMFNPDAVKTIAETCGVYGAAGPCPGDSPYTRGGRSTVLVTAVGEEAFIDANGNGLFDFEEDFEELGEAFRDDNEDGVYSPSDPDCVGEVPAEAARCLAGSEEVYVDYDTSGDYTAALVDPDWEYNGLACPTGGEGCSQDLILVRDSLALILSPADPLYLSMVDVKASPKTKVSEVVHDGNYVVYFSDFYNNRPAVGSEIEIIGLDKCEILTLKEFTVPDSSAPGAYAIGLNLGLDTESEALTSRISVKITNPEGSTTQQTFNCATPPPVP